MKNRLLSIWLAYTLGSVIGCVVGYLILSPETFPRDLLGALIALPVQQLILLMSFMAMFEHIAYAIPAAGWVAVIVGSVLVWRRWRRSGLALVALGAAALSWRAIFLYWGIMAV